MNPLAPNLVLTAFPTFVSVLALLQHTGASISLSQVLSVFPSQNNRVLRRATPRLSVVCFVLKFLG